MRSATPIAVGTILILMALGTASHGQGIDNRRMRSGPMGEAAAVTGKILTISWQRLLTPDGKTCDRCGGTEESITAAERQLAAALSPLGFRVVVEKKGLGETYFSRNTAESNRIWIGNRPIEELLQAAVGTSACCGPCGDNECRTMAIDGRMYETIPPYLIVRAGLKAAADLLTPTATEATLGRAASFPSPGSATCCPATAACCPPAGTQKNSSQAPTRSTAVNQERVLSLQRLRPARAPEVVAGGPARNRPIQPEPGTRVFLHPAPQQADKGMLRLFGNRLY